MRSHFERLGNIIRDKGFEYLRDHTEWVFVPSLDDLGQLSIMPQPPLNESLLSGFIGTLQGRIKKVSLGTNPLRLSFNGKEVVINRYNLFSKLKQNHHPRLNVVQEKSRELDAARNLITTELTRPVSDTYRVARTILH